MKTVEERFLAKVEPEPMSGCWLWTGATSAPEPHNRHGYGLFSWNKKLGMAHRFSYEFYKGTIPTDRVLDHRCQTPACVNPDHLRVMTQRENVLRSDTALAALNAAKTHCARGHEYTPENTYGTPCGRRHCRTCTRENGRRFYARRRRV